MASRYFKGFAVYNGIRDLLVCGGNDIPECPAGNSRFFGRAFLVKTFRAREGGPLQIRRSSNQSHEDLREVSPGV
jgi:hypothetical protein